MSDFWSDPLSTSILRVWTVKALAILRRCAGSPEPSLVTYVISTIISWSGSYIVDCRPLPHFTNGDISISSGTMYNSRATYKCHRGYRLTGSATRICTLDGWSGMAPVCSLIDCGPPTNIDNGHVSTSNGTAYQRVATYNCNYNYALRGVKTRTCLVSGYWSDVKPSCVYLGKCFMCDVGVIHVIFSWTQIARFGFTDWEIGSQIGRFFRGKKYSILESKIVVCSTVDHCKMFYLPAYC